MKVSERQSLKIPHVATNQNSQAQKTLKALLSPKFLHTHSRIPLQSRWNLSWDLIWPAATCVLGWVKCEKHSFDKTQNLGKEILFSSDAPPWVRVFVGWSLRVFSSLPFPKICVVSSVSALMAFGHAPFHCWVSLAAGSLGWHFTSLLDFQISN